MQWAGQLSLSCRLPCSRTCLALASPAQTSSPPTRAPCPQVEARLAELQVLLPSLAARVAHIRPSTLATLLKDPAGALVPRLITLTDLLPGGWTRGVNAHSWSTCLPGVQTHNSSAARLLPWRSPSLCPDSSTQHRLRHRRCGSSGARAPAAAVARRPAGRPGKLQGAACCACSSVCCALWSAVACPARLLTRAPAPATLPPASLQARVQELLGPTTDLGALVRHQPRFLDAELVW